METRLDNPAFAPAPQHGQDKLLPGPISRRPITGEDTAINIRTPLHIKLMAAISVLLCLLLCMVGFTVNQQMQQSMRDDFLKRGVLLAHNLELLNTIHSPDYGLEKIQQNVELVVRQNNLLYATIHFFNGDLAAYGGRKDLREAILTGTPARQGLKSKAPIVQNAEHQRIAFCEISVPISLAQGKRGIVRIGFPRDRMLAATGKTRIRLLGIGCLAIFLGGAAAFLISRRITRPVKDLVRSMEALSQGEYEAPNRIRSQDEIGCLFRRYRTMQATVREKITGLTQTNAELSLANTKLNREINQQRKAAETLLNRDAVLTAINHTTQQLLWQRDWRASMPDILAGLGQTLGIRQIFLTRCDHEKSGSVDQVLSEWRNPSLPAVSDFAPQGAGNTRERIPLWVGGELWGRLVYYKSPGTPPPDTIQTVRGTMQALAGNLAAAIERRETMENLEAANRAKDDFLANMSHELRTPLNHIIGFTELVLSPHVGKLNPLQSEYLEDVLGSSKHLLSLINDVLDLAKIEAGQVKFEPQPVNIRKLLENSLYMVREKALKHKIRITFEELDLPEKIFADERLLKQVIYNLLGNALKFTPDKGRITLEARMTEGYFCRARRKNDTRRHYLVDLGADSSRRAGLKKLACLKVTVADTGIGLAPENLTRVFDRFNQAKSSSLCGFGGTGLGLALAKNFIDLHGGRIWAESEGEGKGSRFVFIIPA